jgi:membrane protease YdiL (CAAX protease family)
VTRRRRLIVSATAAAGTCLLGASLSTRPGSTRFYALTGATAATWVAGGLLSGPLPVSPVESRGRRPAATASGTGAAAFAAFGLAALVAPRVPVLHRAVCDALTFAERGSTPLVLLAAWANGVGEEVFFRGAVYAALPGRDPVAGSTAVYTLVTTATRNPALTLAAVVMGAVFGRQRRATGSIRAPLVTHLAWSTLMVTVLPRVLRRFPPPRGARR